MSFKRMMSLIAMAFIWTGSQIPVYIFGKSTRPMALLLSLTNLQALSLHTFMPTSAVLIGIALSSDHSFNTANPIYSWIWFVLANLLALAGVCPFVGSLSDLLGRRYVALFGSFLVILGMIVSSTAKIMNTFIGERPLY